jgi:hypothetical protein
MGLLNGATNPVGAIFFYLALFGVAAGSAHIVTRWFVERRLRRRQAVAPPAPEARQVAQEDARPPEGSRRSSRHGAARRR